MANVLVYADTVRSPELRHEVPLTIPDPFTYAEVDGAKHVLIGSMEIPRLAALGAGLELHPPEEVGIDELIAQGLAFEELRGELAVRFCKKLGIDAATVPPTFPLQLADLLRSAGIELTPDRELFAQRRRVKTGAELAGIRRAQQAAEAGMAAAADMIRRAEARDGVAVLDGEPLTSERIKSEVARAFTEHDATADEFIVAHGAQSAIGHEMGSGAIAPGEAIVIDLWPRDNASACFADMTRTFVVGEPSAELAEWHRLTKEALDRSFAEIRAGVRGRAVFDASCGVYEEAGYPTQRTKEPGKPLDEGFYHGLGHGVGLEVHEEPGMGIVDRHELLAGDVVTVEPGVYKPGVGGCRIEDLLLVTDDGFENLTRFPYDLKP